MIFNRSFTAGELAGNEELNRHGSLRYNDLQQWRMLQKRSENIKHNHWNDNILRNKTDITSIYSTKF